MQNTKVVLILSGGMDSTTLLYDLLSQGYEVYALGFNYGQRHKKELSCAKETCKTFGVPYKVVSLAVLNKVAPSSLTRKDIDVPEGRYDAYNMRLTVVPNRNMVMISIATSYAIGIGATKLFYGAHAGDHVIYLDCRPEFVNAMQKSIKLCDEHQIDLEAPYLKFDKGDILERGIELQVDYSKTWTCYKGKEKACGKCGSCDERLEAFAKNGVTDPLRYEDE